MDQFSDAILQLDQKLDLRQNVVLRGLGRVRQYDWEIATVVVRNAYLRYFGLTMNGSRFQTQKVFRKHGSAQSSQTIDRFQSFQECFNHKRVSYTALQTELTDLFQRSHL